MSRFRFYFGKLCIAVDNFYAQKVAKDGGNVVASNPIASIEWGRE